MEMTTPVSLSSDSHTVTDLLSVDDLFEFESSDEEEEEQREPVKQLSDAGGLEDDGDEGQVIEELTKVCSSQMLLGFLYLAHTRSLV